MAELLDRQIFNDKAASYRGSVRVDLLNLEFETPTTTRVLDRSNVQRLLQIFELEGCRHYDPENAVPAVISEGILSTALAASRLDHAALRRYDEPPILNLPESEKLTILHGYHRLFAGSIHLEFGERDWVVELYSDDLSVTARTALEEEYSNERKFSDGDIYRHLRHHQRRQDAVQEGKWLARLTKSKLEDLRQLKEKIGGLQDALDRLLPVPGLWGLDVKLGTLHRVLPIKCYEESIHYLDRVFHLWSHILGGDESLFSHVDASTVTQLEALTPFYAANDASKIGELMRLRRIFPSITNEATRDRLLQNILSIKGRILSIYTFLEDTKILEVLWKILRQLFPDSGRTLKRSLRRTFYHNYTGVNQTRGQARLHYNQERGFITRNCGSQDVLWISYVQCALYAFRNFTALSGIVPRKGTGKHKPKAEEEKAERWHGLAELAWQLGFDSDKIRQIRLSDPDHVSARSFLRSSRDTEGYTIDEGAFPDAVTTIGSIVKRLYTPRIAGASPTYTTDNQGLTKNLRYGMPMADLFTLDRHCLFFGYIYDQFSPSPKQNMTSLAIQRDIFISFFGSPPTSLLLHPESGMLPDQSISAGPTDEADIPTAPGFETQGLPLEKWNSLNDSYSLAEAITAYHASNGPKPILFIKPASHEYFKFLLQSSGDFPRLKSFLSEAANSFAFLKLNAKGKPLIVKLRTLEDMGSAGSLFLMIEKSNFPATDPSSSIFNQIRRAFYPRSGLLDSVSSSSGAQ